MTDTTTIEVRKDQAEWLKDYRRENGNYKTAIDRLIEIQEDTPQDLSCADPTQVDPDKLMDKLNTIEAAAKEATKAAQDTQTTVEGLQ